MDTMIRIILILIGMSIIAGCSGTKTLPDDVNDSGQEALKNTYQNAEYDIKIDYPQQWILLEEPNLETGDFAINLFKRNTGAEQEVPLGVHSSPEHTYLSIWPHGLGTELPFSQYTTFQEYATTPKLSFQIDNTASKVLLLESGKAWAYFIVPKHTPAKWASNGFIFAQIDVVDFEQSCLSKKDRKEINPEKCDPLEGDQPIRKGSRNKIDARLIHNMLESLSLEQRQEQATAADLIEINKPEANMDVSSPLKIRGQAKDHWYFEGQFPIELYDAQGNLLAKTVAHAQEDETSSEFVPFKATVPFDSPGDQRGKLVFERANPSGLSENEMQYSQPVIFDAN